jgi:sugar/nucleoside kinase (ribokinase family)|tara:strand:+ start:98 stop:1228 length:1131 start_codon:yes stop_codon:yes gene_type:complete
VSKFLHYKGVFVLEDRKNKIVVVGNATLDVLVRGTISIEEDSIIIAADGIVQTFHVEDPPIRAGHKHRVNENIAQKVRSLWHRIEPGGGGFNSATSIKKIPSIGADLDLIYMDVSTPDPLIVESLRAHYIQSHFFYQRDVPVNAVIGWRDDKIVLKGPQLGRVQPDQRLILEAADLISGSNAILVNSIKDPKYFDEYFRISQEQGIPMYMVVTSSLDKDFIFERVLPKTIPILNYDELPNLLGARGDMDEESKMQFALETLRQIRKDGINRDKPIYVTLGKNGAYCAKKDSIIYVGLDPEYSERVSRAIVSRTASINGAGDSFAAGITAYDTISARRIDLNDLVREASTVAIRGIGYKGPLPANAFVHKEHKMSSG